MNKTITKTILLLLFSSQVFAQSEQTNHEKYWNFRDNLKRKYLKVGNLSNGGFIEPGLSMPIENLDNINIGCGGNGKRMRWGDATIHQGYYLAMLATEYELLRRNGKDYQGTLNELYYAIAALNRLDDKAESYLNFPNNPLPPNRNGFLMRDDVPGNFNNNFQAPAPNNISCIQSERYNSENGSPNNNFYNNENEMSQDQIYGLLLGFSFVKKFIDPNIVVQPTPQDSPINLVNEVASITDRIMSYSEQQWSETRLYWAGPTCGNMFVSFVKNWTIKNPITQANVTRGANMAMFVPYAADQANLINGLSYNGNVSYAIDFPGLEPQCLNSGSTNVSVSFPHSWIKNIWNSAQSLNWSDFAITFQNIPDFHLNSLTFSSHDETYNVMDNSNRQMMLSVVSCSNAWTKANTGRLAWDANMGIFDLVRSVLHGGGAWASQSAYFNELNLAPCEGPSSATSNNTASWRSSSRWWKPSGSTVTGEFNGIDYMLLYNLYMLEFGNQIPTVSFRNESCPCASIAKKIDPYINSATGYLLGSFVLDRKFPEYLNFQISVPEFLTQHLTLLNPSNLTLNTELVVCNNSILKTWSSNSLILGTPSGNLAETGVLRVRSGSQFWLEANGEAIVYPNSKIIIEKGATFILRDNAKLIVNDMAQVIVEPGATFLWGNGSQIVMQGAQSLFDIQCDATFHIQTGQTLIISKGTASTGGTVNLHGGQVVLENNATIKISDAIFNLLPATQFNYQAGGDIQLLGNNAILSLQNQVILGNNANFTFSYPNANSGQIELGEMTMTAGTNCKFNILGQGKNDVILHIAGKANLPDNLIAVNILDGTIKGILRPTSTQLSLSTGSDPVRINNCIGMNYESLSFFGQHVYVTNSDFTDNVIAISDFFALGKHYNPTIANCTFTRCDIPVLTYGVGLMMNNNSFTNNTSHAWNGLGLSQNAYIGFCSFTDNDQNSLGTQFSFSSFAGQDVFLNSSLLQNTQAKGYFGIEASGGVLRSRCTAISGNKLDPKASVAMAISNNGVANLSNDFSAGFCNLSQNSSLILLDESTAELNNGYNNFGINQTTNCLLHQTNCIPYVQGTLNGIACNGNAHILPADYNDWNNAGTISPNKHTFDLKISGCTDDVYYADATPLPATSCPAVPVIIQNNNTNPFINGLQLSTINTPNFTGTKLNHAVNAALSLMDTSVTNGYKSSAEFLAEILSYTISQPTVADKYVQEIAYRKLMEAMSMASYYGQVADSTTALHMVVTDLQNGSIATATANGNYNQKLFTTIDRAAIFRSAGDLQTAIALLNDALAWTMPAQQNYVNEWLCYYTAEYNLKTGSINRNDFTTAIASCKHRAQPKGTYQEQGVTVKTNEDKNLFAIIPNPNNGKFIIKTIEPELASIEIVDATGKLIYQKGSGISQEIVITLPFLAKGIYLVKVISKNGIIQTERMVIE